MEEQVQDWRPEFTVQSVSMHMEQASSVPDGLCQRVGEGSSPGTISSGSGEEEPWDACVGGGHNAGPEEIPGSGREWGQTPRQKLPEGRGTQSPGQLWQCREHCGEGSWKGGWSPGVQGAEDGQAWVRERRPYMRGCRMTGGRNRMVLEG